MGEKMGDTTHQHQHQHPPTASRLGVRNTGGEIVEVQGGHIVRSTGRKDRHSKVCTAKGPRDRRVRLSANTAIQFYDVQDRLGYDRPSKAVDWLIKKAKAAIDELDELPAWKPTAGSSENPSFEGQKQQQQQQFPIQHGAMVGGDDGNNGNSNENDSSFLPPSMDSDSIADTIKSFFPMGASTDTSSGMEFQNFPPPPHLVSTCNQSQDLRLSLQSFQDPMLLHHHNQQPQHQHSTNQTEQALFSGLYGSGWSENQPAGFQRMVSWNAGGDGGGGGGAFMFNSPSTPPLLQPLFGQNQLFSQRGPLQSSNTLSVRAWIDPSAISAAATDHHQHQHQQSLPFHPSSISSMGFASGGEFSGFRIPTRIQGEEEERDGISDKPSSASSDSRH